MSMINNNNTNTAPRNGPILTASHEAINKNGNFWEAFKRFKTPEKQCPSMNMPSSSYGSSSNYYSSGSSSSSPTTCLPGSPLRRI